jgi:hypothetical protein
MTWSQWPYFPSEGRRVTDFIAFKNPPPSAKVEPANLWSDGKHANDYTTEEDLTHLNIDTSPSNLIALSPRLICFQYEQN